MATRSTAMTLTDRLTALLMRHGHEQQCRSRETGVCICHRANDVDQDVKALGPFLAEQEPDETNGHGQPCFICGEPCNNLIGNPTKWATALVYPNTDGIVEWHHAGCVVEKLQQAEQRETALREECLTSVEPHWKRERLTKWEDKAVEAELQVAALTRERDDARVALTQCEAECDRHVRQARADLARVSGQVARVQALAQEWAADEPPSHGVYYGRKVKAALLDPSKLVALATPTPAVPASPWQPIETAPHDTAVLVVDARGWRCCAKSRDGKSWWTEPGMYSFKPTAWMPLPEGPTPATEPK